MDSADVRDVAGELGLTGHSDIDKPVILIGTGRSGSSALHRLLARHPCLAWLSSLANNHPSQPYYNRWLMQSLDVPLLGTLLKRHYVPSEAYSFWRQHAPGFGKPFRDLTAADVTNREKAAIRAATMKLATRRRNRLLLKVTGWPRLGYLAECFPEAKFIHLVRDGRAVANSMLGISFWDGWSGPVRWRWDLLPSEQKAAWNATGCSFVALAAYEWIMMLDAVEKARRLLPSRQFLEVKYEDLCKRKTETLQQIADFSELAWTGAFARTADNYPLINRNSKWRRDLTSHQQKVLENVLGPCLAKYGYECS